MVGVVIIMNCKMIIFEILLSVLLGAIIGFQREEQSKNAGLKTHILVALGSTTIMIISKYGFFDVLKHSSVVLDPSRISAQIVGGLGFICAGIIFLNHDVVSGLTTSVGIWNTAAIGMAVGAGMYTLAIITTIILFIVLQFISKYTYHYFQSHINLFITTYESIDEINQYYQMEDPAFKNIKIKIFKISDDTTSFVMSFTISNQEKLRAFYQQLRNSPKVVSVEID